MTAHELAQKLLEAPNIPVVINGWGSDEGTEMEVTGIIKPEPNATSIALGHGGVEYKTGLWLDWNMTGEKL